MKAFWIGLGAAAVLAWSSASHGEVIHRHGRWYDNQPKTVKGNAFFEIQKHKPKKKIIGPPKRRAPEKPVILRHGRWYDNQPQKTKGNAFFKRRSFEKVRTIVPPPKSLSEKNPAVFKRKR